MEYGNGDTNHLVWKSISNRYHHEEDDLTLDNPNVNIALLGREIQDGSYVLDIGCGEGKFGRLIRDKGCHIYGVDIDQDALDYVKQGGNYKDVFLFNVEMPELNIREFKRFTDAEIKFDYIALIDVLEHTINPTKVLEMIFEFLKDDGKVLVSIPNINNADIALNLLRGRFNYMEAGILDNTHTKYFTKTSFLEWICEVNNCRQPVRFDCKYIGGVFGLTEYLEKVKKEMPRVFDLIQLNPEYSIVQNLFILYKKAPNEELKHLDILMAEKRIDLVEILSEWMEKGTNEKVLTEINGIKMLPNERYIMEEKSRVAEKGWKECDAKLLDAIRQIENLRKKYIEIDEAYQKALEDIKRLDEKCKKNFNGWKRADEKYHEIFEEWKKSETNYQEALTGWKKSEDNYQEALVGWKKSEDNYQKALAGWKKSEDNYQEALVGWKKCDEMLQRAASEKEV